MTKYIKPKVFLLNHSGMGFADIGARLAYDSLDKSENKAVRHFRDIIDNTEPGSIQVVQTFNKIKDIKSSKLLEQLTWVHHHGSVLEHIWFTFYIGDIPRSVLQELSRHRHASLTVRSTRYTGDKIINAYFAATKNHEITALHHFISLLKDVNIFTTINKKINDKYLSTMFTLIKKEDVNNKNFKDLVLSREAIELLNTTKYITPEDVYAELNKCKRKRNAFDSLKHVIPETLKTELIWTINLRSLKNFLKLRDSGSAWYPMQQLAKEIKNQIPQEYLPLIDKN